MMELQKILSQDPFFWFFALTGTGLFLIQLLLSLFGMYDHHTHDIADDLHGEVRAGGFKWITKQTLTGFVMFFGFAGLTCRKEFGLSISASVVWGLAAGLVAVFATALIFKIARKLHHPGAVFNLDDAVGKEAVVYQRIPKSGSGKISLTLNQQTHEVYAVSANKEEIASFSHVQIIKKEDDRTVAVKIKGKPL